MSERMTHKIIYSGCDHDPAETSKGFCWQCRVAQLEAKVADLEVGSQRWQVSYRLQKKENKALIHDLHAYMDTANAPTK